MNGKNNPQWVPSHTRVTGVEKARAGAAQEMLVPDPTAESGGKILQENQEQTEDEGGATTEGT